MGLRRGYDGVTTGFGVFLHFPSNFCCPLRRRTRLPLSFCAVGAYCSLMRVLIVGCGYVGIPLGAELVKQGQEVFGLRRSTGAEAEFKSAGIKPLTADVTKTRMRAP